MNHHITLCGIKKLISYRRLVILVPYPTQGQLDNMRPVTGNNPAERQRESQKIHSIMCNRI